MKASVTLFLSAVAVLAASSHEIYLVTVPGEVSAGVPFTVEVVTRASSNGSSTPIACIRAPEGWPVEVASAGRLSGGGEKESITATYDADDTANMEAAYAVTGTTWRCYRGPSNSYSSGLGSISFTLEAAAPGMHTLAFAAGAEYFDFSSTQYSLPDGEVVSRNVNVGGPTHYLHDWQAALTGPLLDYLYVVGDRLWGHESDNEYVLRSSDGVTWEQTEIPWVGSSGPVQILAAGGKTLLLYHDAVYDYSDGTPVNVYDAPSSLNAIAHDGNRFIVVGADGLTATSPDAEPGSWSETIVGSTDFSSIATENGTTVIGGSGAILYPNGATWAVASVSLSGAVTVVAHDGEFWVTDTLGNAMKASVAQPGNWTSMDLPGQPHKTSYAHQIHFAGGNGESLYWSYFNSPWEPLNGGVPYAWHIPVEFGNYLVLNQYTTVRPHFAATAQKNITGIRGRENLIEIEYEVDGRGTAIFGGNYANLSEPLEVREDTCAGKARAARNLRCMLKLAYTPGDEGDWVSLYSPAITWPVYEQVQFTIFATSVPNQPPVAPALVYPAADEADVSLPVELIWKKTEDPNGDPVAYEVLVCENESFDGCAPKVVQTAALQQPWGGVLGGMAGMVIFGLVFYRRKGLAALALVFAVAGGCAGDAAENLVRKFVEENDEPKVPPKPGADEMGYTIGGLKPGTKYFWKVVVNDGFEGRSESEVRSFTTAK